MTLIVAKIHVLYCLQGKDEFMGRCVVRPTVKLRGQGPPAPKLLWHPVTKGKLEGGEILAAFEMFLVRIALFYLLVS